MKRLRYRIHCSQQRPNSTSCLPGPLWSCCRPVQHIIADVNCTMSVETSTYPACPENSNTAAGHRLSAHIHHASTFTHCWASTLQFADQFAFRPTGSTTTAIITLLNTVISLLSSELYVIVISLDFSNAFDTVRQSSLLHKLAQLNLPDHVYNWLADFFSDHSHCTLFQDQHNHPCLIFQPASYKGLQLDQPPTLSL